MTEYCEECGRKISEREALDNNGLCNECLQEIIEEAINTGIGEDEETV